jgi:hypothetical protein
MITASAVIARCREKKTVEMGHFAFLQIIFDLYKVRAAVDYLRSASAAVTDGH